MKYQPNNLFIGDNKATNHIIASFLNEILKSLGRFKGTWSPECSNIPQQSFSTNTLQHVL